MKKWIAYVLTAVSSFVLGVVVSPIHFRLNSIACGPKGSSSQFTSSYLLYVVSSERWYETADEADAAWQEQLKASVSVLEQTDRLDRDGQKTGSRAVVKLKWENSKEYFGVIWTDRNLVLGVYCSSLAHVLAFEKRRP